MIKVQQKGNRDYRLDHDELGDVYRTTYKEGTIKDFGYEKTDPFTLNDTCEVEGEVSGKNIPILYHCKKDHYDATVATKRGNNALKGAARAFRTGQKVKVLLESGTPKFVVGHQEGKRPKRCLDIFKMKVFQYATGAMTSPTPGKPHEIHYLVSDPKEYGPMDAACKEPDGQDLKLNEKQRRLFGFREFQLGTIVNFYGDWLIKVGPLMVIFRVGSVGLPGPMTSWIKILAGIWTEEREAQAIAIGKQKEGFIPKTIFATGYDPMNFEIDYPGTYYQTALSKVFNDRFKGWTYPQPRWIYTEFYSHNWDG
ncbi:MAG: hypothetical protein AB1491_00090 [Thermodesulfobacteriota bacterium]